MQMKSFKLFSLATIMSLNSVKAAVCAPAQTGTPVIGYAQPSNVVENCGQAAQPLVYDNSMNGQNMGGFTPECLVGAVTGMPGAFIPGQTPVQPTQSAPPMECVPVNPQNPSVPYNPPMAATIINPPSEPNNGNGGHTPPSNGSNKQYVPPSGTPPPPKPETQCTVTTKLDCDPVPGTENNTPPTTPLTPVYPTGGNGEHVQSVVPVYSVVPPPIQPQRIYSVVTPPPRQFIPSNQPMVCQTTQNQTYQPQKGMNGGSTTSYGNIVPPPPTCIQPQVAPPQQHITPSPVTPSKTISSASGTGVSTAGAMTMCSNPQNALNALCATGNAVTAKSLTSSNTGAACSLPNAENCLVRAIENVGKVPPHEVASCALPAKQPMVDIGMLVLASDAYTQAWNNPCVMS